MRKISKKPNSIRWRMVIIYSLLTVVGFGVVLFSVSRIVQSFLVNQRVSEQRELVQELAISMADDVAANQANALYRFAVEQAQKVGGRILIVDSDAIVQVDSYSVLNARQLAYPEVANVLWGTDYSQYRLYQTKATQPAVQSVFSRMLSSLLAPKTWVAHYCSSIDFGGQKQGAVVLAVSIQDVYDQISDIQNKVTTVMLLVVLAVIAVSFFTASSLTKPIVSMTGIIRRIGMGELNLRVKVDSSSREIEQLGKTFNDMTERLENTDRFRSEFVSNASHEIKTPLATMKILLESLLYQEKLDEKITREFLGDINQEIDRLNSVVSDLLRLVQIDREQSALKCELCRIDEMCRMAIKRLGTIAEKKSISLQAKLAEVSGVVDPIKFEQVIFNLIDNAIKYTDEGGSVNVYLSEKDGYGIFAVKDTGIGIPQSDIAHIFERFYRVDKARARATGGTGLGLSIVEKIIRLHGGTIDVNSEEGKGTTFTVTVNLGGGKPNV